MKKIHIGLIGFGTIGTGVVRLLSENESVISSRLGAKLVLKKIADLDIKKERGIALKNTVLTKDANDVLSDKDIKIVIELVGGYEPAKTFIKKAFENGKCIVTANKALLATYGDEIFKKASSCGKEIAFEASVGGGIPIIKAIREAFVANNIGSIYGIINGTANYILSKMTNEGGKFEDVLKKAQEKGYAEADSKFDIEGIDTAHKLAILLNISYGTTVDLKDIYTEGITKITPLDIKFAKEFGFKIKLLAIAKSEEGEIEAKVHPTMIPQNHLLSTVDGAYNAIFISGDAAGSQMYYGRGAGMMPTASAVVADIVDVARNILFGSPDRVPLRAYQNEFIRPVKIRNILDSESRYYLRFSATDKPGVLSKISGVLGEYNISIASMIQKGRHIEGGVPIVLMTHEAKEDNIQKALKKIDTLNVITDKSRFIRIEDHL